MDDLVPIDAEDMDDFIIFTNSASTGEWDDFGVYLHAPNAGVGYAFKSRQDFELFWLNDHLSEQHDTSLRMCMNCRRLGYKSDYLAPQFISCEEDQYCLTCRRENDGYAAWIESMREYWPPA